MRKGERKEKEKKRKVDGGRRGRKRGGRKDKTNRKECSERDKK